MKIALVHDYLVHVRGGERVFQALCEMYPEADVFTFVYDSAGMPAGLAKRSVHASFIQRLPFSKRAFRAYFLLYPLAAISTMLTGYKLVISSSSAWAHSVTVDSNATHICYCHSPFRYIWSHYDQLIAPFRLRKALLKFPVHFARRLDFRASQRVDAFIANSLVTKERISAYYHRESAVIPPPVEIERFSVSSHVDDYFLVVSALLPYKRVDIVVEAFNRLRLPLKVVGSGPEIGRLQSIAGPTVQFTGAIPDDEVADLYAKCRALIFPTFEDFGIVPLEAMACGRPVIAYAKGGALETVVDNVTGAFFYEQTADAVVAAVQSLNDSRFVPLEIRRHASQFGTPLFKEKVGSLVSNLMIKARSYPTIPPQLPLDGNRATVTTPH